MFHRPLQPKNIMGPEIFSGPESGGGTPTAAVPSSTARPRPQALSRASASSGSPATNSGQQPLTRESSMTRHALHLYSCGARVAMRHASQTRYLMNPSSRKKPSLAGEPFPSAPYDRHMAASIFRSACCAQSMSPAFGSMNFSFQEPGHRCAEWPSQVSVPVCILEYLSQYGRAFIKISYGHGPNPPYS
jgi:hypothetical protein